YSIRSFRTGRNSHEKVSVFVRFVGGGPLGRGRERKGREMSFESAGAMPWRNAYAHLKSERVLSHNVIVGAGTILAGLLGVAFQSLVSHQLRPADYGGVFAVITLITFIGLPASALTLLMARE